MTGRLDPYPRYKASGLSWIGDVPAHWQIRRNGQLFAQRKETGFAELPILEVSLHTGVRVRRFDGSTRKQVMSDRSKYRRAAQGDVAYNMMRMWQGAVGVVPQDGLVSPAYVVASPFPGTVTKYFAELFRTAAYKGEVDAHSHGIVKDRNRLYWEDFKQIFSVCPPPEEQLAIVRFIRDTDRQIVRYIRAQQSLANLLRERDQAIIHDELTPRTNGKFCSANNGIQGVSSDWQTIRLGRHINLISGFPFASGRFSQSPDDIRLLRGINVSPGQTRWDAVVRWPMSDRSSFAQYELQPGDIVIGLDRPLIQSGTRVAVLTDADTPALLLQRVARIRPSDEIVRDYLLLVLESQQFADYLAAIFTGISVPHLSPTQIRDFQVTLPSIPEQRAIVERVGADKNLSKKAVANLARVVTLLREYRTRLITDVVTGQLDVREAAESLPDEVYEPDELSLVDEILEEAGEQADLGVDELVEEVAE